MVTERRDVRVGGDGVCWVAMAVVVPGLIVTSHSPTSCQFLHSQISKIQSQAPLNQILEQRQSAILTFAPPISSIELVNYEHENDNNVNLITKYWWNVIV
ncbi:hypothetical protein BRARA_F02834 [Brassica rapa]|uniref:Uncharacterized protein n=1 Tax=Brassica campestris TaxID=3711 RepID=A0A397ZBJ6_BRACM|nr:hypothetical protein BRARA_F02834 [Brassica rapa]